ncbi:hypothetical protein SRHO_G00199490 [Serrasalmus rhombeus]
MDGHSCKPPNIIYQSPALRFDKQNGNNHLPFGHNERFEGRQENFLCAAAKIAAICLLSATAAATEHNIHLMQARPGCATRSSLIASVALIKRRTSLVHPFLGHAGTLAPGEEDRAEEKEEDRRNKGRKVVNEEDNSACKEGFWDWVLFCREQEAEAGEMHSREYK